MSHKMNNSSLTYEIDPLSNNYYYQNYNEITRKILNLPNKNNSSNSTISFNSFNNNYRYNKQDYFNLYNKNMLNNDYNGFSKQNINFNKHANRKILLTYEYQDISPMEIVDHTKEIIKLQSQMCNLNNKNKTLSKSQTISTLYNGRNKKIKKMIKNHNIKKTNNKFQSQKNFNKKKNLSLFNLSMNHNTQKSKIKKNKTISYNNTSIQKSRFKSVEPNGKNSWKNKYSKVNEDINEIKRKIEEVKKNNNKIEKRLKYVKDKEEKKYMIYENKDKIVDYDIQLLEKYQLSEKIRKKQIDLIIKMQKEINNMREKLQMLGDYCLN